MFPLVLPAGTFKERKKIMRTFKVMALTLAGVLSASVANAQDEVEATVSADVVSNYIWRGQKLGEGSIQPTLGISYKGLSLSAWGSYGITNPDDTKEFDLTLAYSTGGFNVGITDYFFTSQYDGIKYFQYGAHSTAHVFEANIGYDSGPLSLQWYTNFSGADGVNNDGERAYSSYFEVAAPFKLGGIDWNASLGVVPFATSFYADASGFAVTNLTVKATKDIKITDTFSVPVFGQITANPSTEKAYFALGFTLQP